MDKTLEMSNEALIREATELRAIYKDLEKRVKTFKNNNPLSEAGRCISFAYTELESSRHWLGEVLGVAGKTRE